MSNKEVADVESLYPQIIVPEETEFEKVILNIADDYVLTDTLNLQCKYHGAEQGWEIIDPTSDRYYQKTTYGLLQIKEQQMKYFAFIVKHKHLDNVYNFCKKDLKIDFVVEKVLSTKGKKAATLLIIDNQ